MRLNLAASEGARACFTPSEDRPPARSWHGQSTCRSKAHFISSNSDVTETQPIYTYDTSNKNVQFVCSVIQIRTNTYLYKTVFVCTFPEIQKNKNDAARCNVVFAAKTRKPKADLKKKRWVGGRPGGGRPIRPHTLSLGLLFFIQVPCQMWHPPETAAFQDPTISTSGKSYAASHVFVGKPTKR